MRPCRRGLRTVETLNDFAPKLQSQSVSSGQQKHPHLKRRKDREECERCFVFCGVLWRWDRHKKVETKGEQTRKGRKDLWGKEKRQNQLTCPVYLARCFIYTASGVWVHLGHCSCSCLRSQCRRHTLEFFIVFFFWKAPLPKLLCMWGYRERDISVLSCGLCVWGFARL